MYHCKLSQEYDIQHEHNESLYLSKTISLRPKKRRVEGSIAEHEWQGHWLHHVTLSGHAEVTRMAQNSLSVTA